MKSLLIIFYRNPQLGKVKTRLAATLGEDAALAIYLKLVAHTRSITEQLKIEKVVYYSDYVDTEDNWPNALFQKRIQEGDDLGTRMMNAFSNGFDMGFEKICIIGTDCYELTPEIIGDAFDHLDNKDAVIGRAHDGGYYLLGMTKLHDRFFQHKQWSTQTVAQQTIEDFKQLQLSFGILPTLNDVDTEADLPPAFDAVRRRR